MSFYPQHQIDHAYKRCNAAIDWLEAHPERHISGALARDVDGRGCSPVAPRAHCFCITGRIAHDLGNDWSEVERLVHFNSYREVRALLEPFNFNANTLAGINDYEMTMLRKRQGLDYESYASVSDNSPIIAALRCHVEKAYKRASLKHKEFA
jgi:hypothetical protein